MDFQLTAILLIFGLLFVLEKIEGGDAKENFAVIRRGYTNPSVLLEPGWAPLPYSINYQPNPKNFGNFGTIGSYPPDPLCFNCDFTRNSVTAPYLHANDLGDQSGELHGKLGRSCSGICGRNYSNLDKPLLVAARATGRPRVCRRLL